MSKFFSTLRYSFGNEDWRTEEEALKIKPQDHVLCITASGDRPLNLLIRPCQKIVCIDANSAQNHLLLLKATAMQQLKYKEYLAFLGALPCKHRLQTLQHLLPYMNEESARFWLKHKKMVAKGILYQGAVERLTSVSAKVFSWVRGKKIRRLFGINNIVEQRKFIREEWDTKFLRKVFNLFLNTFLSRVIIEDPGLENVSSDITPGNYIYDRMNASLERELAKKNPLLSLILKGEVAPEAFAPCLTEEGTKIIKERLNVLEVNTTNVLDYLESLHCPTFDAFSISDVASYLSYPNFIRLLRGIVKTSKPGARFCLRQFMSTYDIPADLQPYFTRDKALEKHLERMDNCFIYRFYVGTIAGESASPIKQSQGTKKEALVSV